MKKYLVWLLERAKEKSTITTVVTLILSLVGITISPEFKEAITTAAISIISAIAIATKESK